MFSSAAPKARPATRAERGQALIVIAMAMIGLLAFVGLTIDSGILFIGEGHLRRAVDAAALAAAAQFRVGSNSDRLEQSAAEVVHMNGVDPTTLVLTICSPGDPTAVPPIPPDPHNDNALCPANGGLHRKLVKVVATTQVRFAFLSIIGIPSTTIQADATSETASVDVVLVIDTSNSMTFDCESHYGKDNCSAKAADAATSMWWPSVCNAIDTADPNDASHPYKGACYPFDQVKHAAVDFVKHLYWPYDRLAIVTFDQQATVVQPLTNTLTVADWVNTIKNLQVSDPRDPNQPFTLSSCGWQNWGDDPGGCVNTSTGGGLLLAGGQFGLTPIRQESVWVVILLTDGAANASQADPNNPADPNEFCPNSTWSTDLNHYDPFCRAADKSRRHTALNPTVYGITQTVRNPSSTFDTAHYDADDYARDAADFVACSAKLTTAAPWCLDSLDYLPPASPGARGDEAGQGALIYAVGLGNLVIDNSQGGGVSCGASCETRIPPNNKTHPCGAPGYDAGDCLLRYIANVGADGNPDPNASTSPDACQGVDGIDLLTNYNPATKPATWLPAGNLSYNCGNYYFSQTGTGLNAVFESIASRIFTRITQ